MTNPFKAKIPTIVSPHHESAERKINMKRISFTMLALLTILITTAATPTASMAASDNFFAVLSGANEVPARDTNARGVATFKLSKDGTSLDFTLIAANIENVVFAHIHCNVAGVNGPIGATLAHAMPAGGGPFSGVLASGTITAPDSPNSCGWTSVADIVAAINSGRAYVNVHTNDGIDPPNTGPGDFPGGEIRGQVQ
jgi:hypothetical protein